MWDILFCVALIVFGYALGSSIEMGITQRSFNILCEELDVLRNGNEVAEDEEGGNCDERNSDDEEDESDDD